jgi:bacillithiol system protein YtxJ
MGLFSFKSESKNIFPWIELSTSEKLHEIIDNSINKPILLFKHSTRCSISSMAKSRFESNWKSENELCDLYYLDLIAFRSVSNEIAELTGVEHQSPQCIVLKNKQVVYDATHSSINASEIERLLKIYSEK